MSDINELARVAYDAYCEAVGGKAFNGDTLPGFDAVPERIRNAWVVSVSAVVRRLEDEHGVALAEGAR
jgi:hypothetical protein